jgi:hypothetical protein
MVRLQCTACGNVFDKRVLTTYSTAGLSGLSFGFAETFLIWPLTLRVFAECPVCKQKVWINVLKPSLAKAQKTRWVEH